MARVEVSRVALVTTGEDMVGMVEDSVEGEMF